MICVYSQLSVRHCKAFDICDCFDNGTGKAVGKHARQLRRIAEQNERNRNNNEDDRKAANDDRDDDDATRQRE